MSTNKSYKTTRTPKVVQNFRYNRKLEIKLHRYQKRTEVYQTDLLEGKITFSAMKNTVCKEEFMLGEIAERGIIPTQEESKNYTKLMKRMK